MPWKSSSSLASCHWAAWNLESVWSHLWLRISPLLPSHKLGQGAEARTKAARPPETARLSSQQETGFGAVPSAHGTLPLSHFSDFPTGLASWCTFPSQVPRKLLHRLQNSEGPLTQGATMSFPLTSLCTGKTLRDDWLRDRIPTLQL
jgi:hypothetical protein